MQRFIIVIFGSGATFSNIWAVQIKAMVSKSMKKKSNNPRGLLWKCGSVSGIKRKNTREQFLWKQSQIIKPRQSISLCVLSLKHIFWSVENLRSISASDKHDMAAQMSTGRRECLLYKNCLCAAVPLLRLSKLIQSSAQRLYFIIGREKLKN